MGAVDKAHDLVTRYNANHYPELDRPLTPAERTAYYCDMMATSAVFETLLQGRESYPRLNKPAFAPPKLNEKFYTAVPLGSDVVRGIEKPLYVQPAVHLDREGDTHGYELTLVASNVPGAAHAHINSLNGGEYIAHLHIFGHGQTPTVQHARRLRVFNQLLDQTIVAAGLAEQAEVVRQQTVIAVRQEIDQLFAPVESTQR